MKSSETDEDIETARAREEIVAGAPLILKNIIDCIFNGENALRVLRGWRGLTQARLSFKVNIGRGYIADIEEKRRTGTAAALRKLATALRVPVELLT